MTPLDGHINDTQRFFCPVEITMNVLSNKWKPQILHALSSGTKRFGEIQRKSGCRLSQKVLTSSLRDLEDHGVITRKVYAQVPPRVEYSLTPLGEQLLAVMNYMCDWGIAYCKQRHQINSHPCEGDPGCQGRHFE